MYTWRREIITAVCWRRASSGMWWHGL